MRTPAGARAGIPTREGKWFQEPEGKRFQEPFWYLQKYAAWLKQDRPGAAGSLMEWLDDMFSINRLGLPSELRRCLGTTNLIDNGHSSSRDRVRRVKHWQCGSMALRWAAVAFDAVSKGFRRIMAYKHLWIVKATLDEPSRDQSLVDRARAG